MQSKEQVDHFSSDIINANFDEIYSKEQRIQSEHFSHPAEQTESYFFTMNREK